MSCGCNKNKLKVVSTPTKLNVDPVDVAISEALAVNLKQCYLCAKKHISRAQILFEEYHTGYPEHIKNLIESLRVAEKDVRQAFLLWQRIMGHLDMAAAELLGKNVNEHTMDVTHVRVANLIRNERLGISDNPQYVPDFDKMLVAIQELQFSE